SDAEFGESLTPKLKGHDGGGLRLPQRRSLSPQARSGLPGADRRIGSLSVGRDCKAHGLDFLQERVGTGGVNLDHAVQRVQRLRVLPEAPCFTSQTLDVVE